MGSDLPGGRLRPAHFSHPPLVPTQGFFSRLDERGVIRLVIQGSTGSIGCSALEIVRQNPSRFKVVGLSAGSNIDLLVQQVREFNPEVVSCRDEGGAGVLRGHFGAKVEVLCGEGALVELSQACTYDLMLAAVVGVAGLPPVLAALNAGRRVALANKEALVSGGRFVAEALVRGGGSLLPVDSEHSALFQVLQGERLEDLHCLILTASGGPFLNATPEQLMAITPEQAVRHPRWSMGAKISIDSATLMNKGLELIEAHWLFGVPEANIEVVVHPQSIVHSLVRFIDGSEVAQLSVPDMKGAIGYAFSYPHGRIAGLVPQLSLSKVGALEFAALDSDRFPAVELARSVLRQGGMAPAVYNLGNELAVTNFIRGGLKFTQIVPFVERALARFGSNNVTSFEGLLAQLQELRASQPELLREFA